MTLGRAAFGARKRGSAASVEYPLALPAANPLFLTFAVSGGEYFYGEGRAGSRQR
jgi:hypothetical protein